MVFFLVAFAIFFFGSLEHQFYDGWDIIKFASFGGGVKGQMTYRGQGGKRELHYSLML